MTAFSQLNEYDKVQAIRDTFIQLFKNCVNNPESLITYIKEEDQKTDAYKLADVFIRKHHKMTSCLCGDCVDLSVVSNGVPSELELLLDTAKQIVETKGY